MREEEIVKKLYVNHVYGMVLTEKKEDCGISLNVRVEMSSVFTHRPGMTEREFNKADQRRTR